MSNKNIIVIPAKRCVGNTKSGKEKPKLKVAAYCRVSTDSDEQASSYETQVEHYSSYITKNAEWEFAGIFADDGISGMNTKKREEFNRMIEECMAGHIDMVITKSISRFARNTLDCLKYIRQLKEKNIPVYFEKENINTMDTKGEVLLTIMASLAQQESESLSKNVKLGLQFRYQKGQVQVNHNRFLGYTKDKKGHLIIEPEGAKIVKRIFREYLEGKTLQKIADGLIAEGYLTAAGKSIWRAESIRTILINEKYMGDALLQKTYTVDVLTRKRVHNNGIVPQYYIENNHEAIIPRALFMQVQAEMKRRANLETGNKNCKKKRIYSGKFALSCIVFCGNCGDLYQRIDWNAKKRGKRYINWRCINRIENGFKVCDAEHISDRELKSAVIRAINNILGGKDTMIERLKKHVEEIVLDNQCVTTEKIDSRLAELQDELVKCIGNQDKIDRVAEEISELRQKKTNLFLISAEREALLTRIKEMHHFLERQTSRIIEYDEQLVRRMIEKIVVYPEKLEFTFKSGISISLRR